MYISYIKCILIFPLSFCYIVIINYGFRHTYLSVLCHFCHRHQHYHYHYHYHRLYFRVFHSNKNCFKTNYFYVVAFFSTSFLYFLKHKIPFVIHFSLSPIYFSYLLLVSSINVTNQFIYNFFILLLLIILFCHHHSF